MTKQVICDLPNASLEISGVKFTPLDDGGVLSEPISDEQAEAFISIPGYSLYHAAGSDEPPAPPAGHPEKPLTKAQLAAKKKAEEEAAAKRAEEEAAAEAAKKAEEEAAATDATLDAEGAEAEVF